MERAALAAAVVALACEMLGLLEVGQHVLVGPAAIAELAPRIVVARLAAHIDHAVDRRGATQRPAARTGDTPAGHALFRLHLEVPVVGLVGEELGEAGRDVDPQRAVDRPRLEQQHLGSRIFGQPVGQHPARRSGTRDDVVVLSHRFLLCHERSCRPERSEGSNAGSNGDSCPFCPARAPAPLKALPPAGALAALRAPKPPSSRPPWRPA